MTDVLREFLGHNFVSDLRTLNPKNLKTLSRKTQVITSRAIVRTTCRVL